MRQPTRDDIDRLVGPATPHFAYQLRARVRELVQSPSADVRTWPQNTSRIARWNVKAQSIQRSASARARRSVGQSVPALCLAQR